MTPLHISAAIGSWYEDHHDDLRRAGNDVCIGAKFHSPSPLLLRKVELVPWDNDSDEVVWLCGTCSDNLLVLQDLLIDANGEVSWEVRREFGNQIRALGLQGWEIYAGRMAGNN